MQVHSKKFIGCFIAAIFLFLITAVSAFSSETFPYPSYDSWDGGTGYFNGLMSETIYGRNLPGAEFTPLVEDLDGDGTNEIIVIDGNNIRLYHDKTLSPVDAFTLPAGTYKYMIAYDIDNDTLNEIITANEQTSGVENITIIEYNGTAFYLQNTFNFSDSTTENHAGDSEILFQCCAPNDCFMAFTTGGIGSASSVAIYGIPFNSTNYTRESYVLSNRVYVSTTAEYGNYYFPAARSMGCEDVNNDLVNEWIFAYTQAIGAPVQSGATIDQYVMVNSNDHGSGSYTTIQTSFNMFDYDAALTSGAADDDRFIASPLAYNYDGSSSNGWEIAGAFLSARNRTEFVFVSGMTGSVTKYWNTTAGANTQMLSNVIKGSYFKDDPNTACVLAYNFENHGSLFTPIHNLICSSLISAYPIGDTATGNQEYFFYSTNNKTNTTHTNNLQIEKVDESRNPIFTDNPNNINFNADEVLCPFGVLELAETNPDPYVDGSCYDPGGIYGWGEDYGTCLASLIWESPYDASFISVDAEKTGLSDIIGMTNTSLIYMDDGFANSNAYFSGYETDPCLDGVWKVNITPQITIEASDIDGDSVRARIVSYKGLSNEQDSGWSGYLASGTSFFFTFEANETGNNIPLSLIVQDSHHNTSNISIDTSFSVALAGYEVGGCRTTWTNTTNETGNETYAPSDYSDTADSIRGLYGQAGSTKFDMIFSFVVIILVMIGVYMVMSSQNLGSESAMLYIPLAAGFIAFVVLVQIGMMPAWTLIMLVLFCAAFLGWKFYQKRASIGGI